MSKTYRYHNIKPKVAANTLAKLEVKFISDGNTGVTNVEIESIGSKSLNDEGSINLGMGNQLKGKIVSVGAKFANPIPEEDTIKIEFLVNGKVVVAHENAKSESDQPRISIIMNFQ